MSQENLNNRSTSMTPELIALVNASTTAAIKEAMAGMSTMMAQVIQEVALTPEKLREATKPYKDPVEANRAIREKMRFRQEEIDSEKAKRLTRDNCPHKYKTGHGAIGVIRNFYDNQPRGLCMLCQDFFTPREWRIGAPTEEEPNGVAYIAPAHPQYQLVRDAIRQQEG
jgi:hypothetical protein